MEHQVDNVRLKESTLLFEDFLKEAKRFALTDDEQGRIAGSTGLDSLSKAIQNSDTVCLKDSAVQRLVLFLSFVNDIKVLYPPERWSRYLRTPNKALDDASPLDLILMETIEGLTRVNTYLKGSMQGGYL